MIDCSSYLRSPWCLLIRIYLVVICLLISELVYGWNALGHRLIAQIAYDKMSRPAKKIFNQYNYAVDEGKRHQSFATSAVWLDKMYNTKLAELKSLHYIDKPFSLDGTPAGPPNTMNAVWGVKMATYWLTNKQATPLEKGIALRILIHIVGDLHQPLHAITKISQQYPTGDRGGNLVRLSKNSIASNLHAYWDKGAGFLVTTVYLQPKHGSARSKQIYVRPKQVKLQARQLLHDWPCDIHAQIINPYEWAEESYNLAKQFVYNYPEDHILDSKYQIAASLIVQQRIALAGCRLSILLNSLYERVRPVKL